LKYVKYFIFINIDIKIIYKKNMKTFLINKNWWITPLINIHKNVVILFGTSCPLVSREFEAKNLVILGTLMKATGSDIPSISDWCDLNFFLTFVSFSIYYQWVIHKSLWLTIHNRRQTISSKSKGFHKELRTQ
jgi:hypothetical protein